MNKKSICSFLLLCVFCINLNAVPASNNITTEILSDGKTITYYAIGDEFCNYTLSEDGYVLFKNESGLLVYAQYDTRGYLIESNVQAHDIQGRTTEEKNFLKTIEPRLVYHPEQIDQNMANLKRSKAFDISGESFISGTYTNPDAERHKRNLVILVEFTDKQFVVENPHEIFTKWLNEENYNETGSVRDYFIASSAGAFQPEFDVIGPFSLANNMYHYSRQNDYRAYQMVTEACEFFNDSIDFTQYDADNDGKIDNVCIIYAGNNAAENISSDAVWPHCGNVPLLNKPKYDNKTLDYYMCTSELRGSGTTAENLSGIGTFCHEFSHLLGLPDLYHQELIFTIGKWDIMDYGSYNNLGRTPPVYSSYERFFMGWLQPEFIDEPVSITLTDLKVDNKAYIIADSTPDLNGFSPTPKEFFLIENRQQTGFDTYLPHHGMLIWHIDYDSVAWSNNKPNSPDKKRIYLVPADEIHSKETEKGESFPGTSGNFQYMPVLWDKTSLEKPITSIKENNGIISFNFMKEPIIDTIPVDTIIEIKVWTEGDFLHISGIDTERKLEIWSIDGKMQLSHEITGDVEIQIFEKGIYVLRLSGGKKPFLRKFLIR